MLEKKQKKLTHDFHVSKLMTHDFPVSKKLTHDFHVSKLMTHDFHVQYVCICWCVKSAKNPNRGIFCYKMAIILEWTYVFV